MIQETTMRGTIGGKEAIRSKEVTVGWVFTERQMWKTDKYK